MKILRNKILTITIILFIFLSVFSSPGINSFTTPLNSSQGLTPPTFISINNFNVGNKVVSQNYVSACLQIVGDNNLASAASTNGWNGAGTSNDPIIINNLQSTNCNTQITNTTKFFVITNSYFTGGSDGLYFTNSSNFEIINSTFDSYNVYANGQSFSRGIYIDNSHNVTIKDNYLNSMTTQGVNKRWDIYMTDSSNCTISNEVLDQLYIDYYNSNFDNYNNTITNNSINSLTFRTSSSVFTNNSILESTYLGGESNTVANNSFNGVFFVDSGTFGISTFTNNKLNSYNLNFINGQSNFAILSTTTSYIFYNCSYIYIQQKNFYNLSLVGLFLNTYNITISSNYFSNVTNEFFFFNSSFVSVTSNTFMNSQYYPLWFDYQCHNVTITGNTFEGTDKYPFDISISPLCYNFTVTSNQFLNGGGFFLGVYGIANNLFKSSTFGNNAIDGKNIIIIVNQTGVIVPSNTGQVFIYNSSNVVVSNLNTINIPAPINVVNSQNVTIEDNTILTNKSYIWENVFFIAIKCYQVQDLKILHNYIDGGIDIQYNTNASNLVINDNTMNYNRHGLYVIALQYYASGINITGNTFYTNKLNIIFRYVNGLLFNNNSLIDSTNDLTLSFEFLSVINSMFTNNYFEFQDGVTGQVGISCLYGCGVNNNVFLFKGNISQSIQLYFNGAYTSASHNYFGDQPDANYDGIGDKPINLQGINDTQPLAYLTFIGTNVVNNSYILPNITLTLGLLFNKYLSQSARELYVAHNQLSVNFDYHWDQGSDTNLTGLNQTISIPQTVGTHTLYIHDLLKNRYYHYQYIVNTTIPTSSATSSTPISSGNPSSNNSSGNKSSSSADGFQFYLLLVAFSIIFFLRRKTKKY